MGLENWVQLLKVTTFSTKFWSRVYLKFIALVEKIPMKSQMNLLAERRIVNVVWERSEKFSCLGLRCTRSRLNFNWFNVFGHRLSKYFAQISQKICQTQINFVECPFCICTHCFSITIGVLGTQSTEVFMCIFKFKC